MMYSNMDIFEVCFRLIEKKMGRANFTTWVNSDFIHLSDDIFRKTKVKISSGTLKRIFGKVKTAEGYRPQLATLNALAEYLDVENWKEFVNQHSTEQTKIEQTQQIPIEQTIQKPRRKTHYWLLFLLIGISIPTALVGLKQLKSKELAILTLKNNTDTTPFTAIFNYDVKNLNADSVFISFRTYDKVLINSCNTQITHFYDVPGIYKAKIIANGEQVSKPLQVIVKTRDWQSIGRYWNDAKRSYDVPMNLVVDSGIWHTTSQIVSQCKMDTSRIYAVELSNIQPFGVVADNLIFETKIKNTDLITSVRCEQVFFDIFGKNGRISFQFANKGCGHWMWLEMGEIEIDGAFSDLSQFEQTLDDWSIIRVENINKKVRINFNGITIYTSSYNRTLGEFYGVKILFLGNGYIDYIDVRDVKNRIILNQDFEK